MVQRIHRKPLDSNSCFCFEGVSHGNICGFWSFLESFFLSVTLVPGDMPEAECRAHAEGLSLRLRAHRVASLSSGFSFGIRKLSEFSAGSLRRLNSLLKPRSPKDAFRGQSFGADRRQSTHDEVLEKQRLRGRCFPYAFLRGYRGYVVD